MGLFTRRVADDPSSWDELWTVLTPLGGSLEASAVERWRAVASAFTPAQLDRAAEQLGYAYRLLDTEAHARALVPGGFTAPGEPFARQRFVRTLDAVVAAGPDAVAQVVTEPSALAGWPVAASDPAAYYDWDAVRPPALGLELLRARTPSLFALGGGLRLGAGATAAWIATPALLDAERLARWPSLRARTRWPNPLTDTPDPEVPWLDVDASSLDADGTGDDDPTSWYAAGDAAAARLFVALGADALHGAAEGVTAVEVEVDAGADPDPLGVPGDGVVTVVAALAPQDAGVQDVAGRVDALVRAVAAALVASDVAFAGAARSRLLELSA